MRYSYIRVPSRPNATTAGRLRLSTPSEIRPAPQPTPQARPSRPWGRAGAAGRRQTPAPHARWPAENRRQRLSSPATENRVWVWENAPRIFFRALAKLTRRGRPLHPRGRRRRVARLPDRPAAVVGGCRQWGQCGRWRGERAALARALLTRRRALDLRMCWAAGGRALFKNK